jgi:poly(A) polymerase
VEIKLLKKSKVLEAVSRMTQKKKEEVFLVGGAVRDFILGRPLGKDFDFVIRGEAEGLAKEVAGEMRGHAFPMDETFGTWRVILKKKKKKTELDFSPMQGKDIFEDLRQRDFTINSIGVNLKEIFHQKEPSYIDPLIGFADINKRIVRANSEESLRRDPLRMLRAFRFASALKFRVEEETLHMIRKNRELILKAAWERIRTEFFAALGETQADQFLRHLNRAGLLGEIFPEVRGWESQNIGIGHDVLLLEHALRTVEAAEFIFSHLESLYPGFASFLKDHFSQAIEEGISRKALFKLAAFLHDSGKPATISREPEAPFPRFLDHDQQGQKINITIGQRLKLSRRSVGIISNLTRQHMRIRSLSKAEEITPRAKYRFFHELGKDGLDLAILALSNSLSAKTLEFHWPLLPDPSGDLSITKRVVGELLRYYFEEFARKPPKPLLDGQEIMKVLKIPPGRTVGLVLEKLKEAELTGKIQTRQEALEFLKNIDRSR